jgi:hypothetical protein
MAKAIRPEQLKNFIWFWVFGRGYRLSGDAGQMSGKASQLRSYPKKAGIRLNNYYEFQIR